MLLRGYELQRNTEQLTVQLYWQVRQPLLPPHHIFIHLDDATGQTLAQYDSVPQSASGPAPTGSWLPDELLVTEQIIAIDALSSAQLAEPLELRIGLYEPTTGQRLPTTRAGASTGDHVTIPLDPLQ
ncbi:MAG: hypothetical protein R2932_12165 [Caldilineaceae bacterium]